MDCLPRSAIQTDPCTSFTDGKALQNDDAHWQQGGTVCVLSVGTHYLMRATAILCHVVVSTVPVPVPFEEFLAREAAGEFVHDIFTFWNDTFIGGYQ